MAEGRTEPNRPGGSSASTTPAGALVRVAAPADLAGVKALFDAHRRELGFVPLPAVRRALDRGWLYVAERDGLVVGAVDWWARRDGTVVLYDIAVAPAIRGAGVGRALLGTLIAWAGRHGARRVRLKCPVELPSNNFYRQQGFTLRGTESGKRRALHCWELEFDTYT